MGNCCATQQTAQPEIDIKAERSRGQQAGPSVTTVVEDPFMPANKQDTLTASPPIEIATAASPAPIDALPLQNVIRGYLHRKKLRSSQQDWLDLGTLQPVLPETAEDTREDPKGLLTKEAAATLARLPSFIYPQRVRNTANLPPQRVKDSGIYIGQWATTASGAYRQGQGKMYMQDGSYIEGYWQAGKPHHLVRIIYPNGDYYEGQCDKGLKSGSGRFSTFDSSLTYEGQWANDKQNGVGKESSQDGTVYEGSFFNNAKTGKGKFHWTDGSWYVGDLLNGEIDGDGEYHWSDGRWYKGQWKDGKMHGKGEFGSSDGKSYIGDYIQDKREGFGVYKWSNNTYEGQWQGNKMHGVGYMTTGDAPRKKFEFREGSKVQELPDS